LRDPRRWLLGVALASALGWLAFSPRQSVKSGPQQPCLAHSDCGKSLRCYAVPKSDPFATFGLCVEPCLDDLQCSSGMRCAVTGKGQQQLLPVAPGLEPGERVCLPGSASSQR
jgi:hypothetical protein